MPDRIYRRGGFAVLSVKRDDIGAFIETNAGKRQYFLDIALSDGLVTLAVAGSFAHTSHVTGIGDWFVSKTIGVANYWFKVSNGFRVFSGVLNQAGTAAPTMATPLQNQLAAAVVWARTSAGLYTGTLVGAWGSAASKVLAQATVEHGSTAMIVRVVRTSADVLTVFTATEAGVAADLVGNVFLDVKVFN